MASCGYQKAQAEVIPKSWFTLAKLGLDHRSENKDLDVESMERESKAQKETER